MRILVVLTGGTISTIVQENTMGIYGNSPYFIIEEYQKMYKKQGNKWKEELPDFDVIEPVRMLSECSRPKYLEQIYYGILAKLGIGKNPLDIREKNIEILDITKKKLNYDGILVTHGSDTLSYSAAFFSVAFSWLPLPFVLTAANYPLSDKNSNGLKNFSDSIDFIRQNLSGVFVVWTNNFRDKTLKGNLYYAKELLEADNYRDYFSSYTGKPFGEIENGKCIIYENREKEQNKKKILDIDIKNDILFLCPYPGLRYDFISLEHTNIKAVVHYLYHSATACIEKIESSAIKEDLKYNLLWFANYCNQLKIPLYLAGFKSKEQRLYETNDLLIKSGLGKPLYHISKEMAYMGILIAYNQNFLSVDEFLKIFMEQ